MSTSTELPHVHVVQLLIRQRTRKGVGFLVYPHETWKPPNSDQPYLVLPTRKSVSDPLAPSLHGEPLEAFVNAVMEEQFGLKPDDFALEEEAGSTALRMPAIHSGVKKQFTFCPVDVWVAPEAREPIRERLNGQWLTWGEVMKHPQSAPSLKAVFDYLQLRENNLDQRYATDPKAELKEENPHRLMVSVPEQPSMYALARRWFSQNPAGMRHLPKRVIDEVLDAGDHAFDLRVADPYLRYQLQGQGFAWSFFTHKDRQDIHVHSAPVVEVYGVLEGQLEIWWKPYYNRGTAAWSHQVLSPGDWLEVDALQCHFVHWVTEGKGVVFKAGPGPLAEAGPLGVKGKTTCEQCPCVKPPEILKLLRKK